MSGVKWHPMPFAQVFHMRDVGFAADGKPCSFQTTHAELHPVHGHDFCGLLSQVIKQCCERKNTVWNIGLEFCVAREDNNGLDGIRRQKVKQMPHGQHVQMVLANGILKFERAIENSAWIQSRTHRIARPAHGRFALCRHRTAASGDSSGGGQAEETFDQSRGTGTLHQRFEIGCDFQANGACR
jgi:hypothetical protein